MALKYDIPAFPTEYKGQRYRSRLEAKWAAFFDMCGWNSTYEPVDLGLWSPDFIIYTAKNPVFVEVKPTRRHDDETARRIHKALKQSGIKGGALLLGICPLKELAGGHSPGYFDDCNENEDDFFSVPFATYHGMRERLDFCHPTRSYRGIISGRVDGGPWAEFLPTWEEIDEIWSHACSAVQWRGRDVP
jgi:hypothetical protein